MYLLGVLYVLTSSTAMALVLRDPHEHYSGVNPLELRYRQWNIFIRHFTGVNTRLTVRCPWPRLTLMQYGTSWYVSGVVL